MANDAFSQHQSAPLPSYRQDREAIEPVRGVVFVDPRVPDFAALMDGVEAGQRAVLLDAGTDGVQQIAGFLKSSGLRDLSAIHIVSHGTPGQIQIGATLLNARALGPHASLLADIGASLAPGGGILLYGCDVASGDRGRAFVQELSVYTGADVAAATHPVGAAAQGGSWELDVSTGHIAARAAFSAEAMAGYQGTLPLTINDVSQVEGPPGTTNFVFTVTLSPANAAVVTVNYTTVPGSASAGTDYQTTSGTLTFQIGETTQQIIVPVFGDLDPEPNEAFTVVLSDPTVDVISDGSGDGNILNDDNFPPTTDLNGTVPAGDDATASFTEQTPVVIAPAATIADVDSTTLVSLTATLTTRPDGNGVESLSLNATAQTAATGAGLTVLYTPGTGVLLINGPAASLATYETILQGIVYNNTSDTPTATDRTVNVVVNDGTDPSAVNTVTISVTAANDAPVTDLNGTVPAGDDATASFTEQTPVVIAPAATIADVDSTTLVSLTATLTTRPDGNGVESLSLNATAQTAATGAGLTVLYTPGTGVLLINGPAASLATYETILQGIVYNNTSDTPTATDRTVNVVVNDGTDPSAVNTVTISVTAANDAPVTDLNGTVPAGDDATASFTEQTPVVIAPAATIADVDSTTLVSLTATLTTRPDGNGVESLSLNATAQTAATGAGLTVLYTPGTGVLLINGPAASLATYETILQGIVYNNTSDTPTATDRTVNVVVNDGTDPSAVNTVTISVTAANDAPVTDLNGTVPAGDDATASFTEQTPVVIAPAATIADVDSTTLVSLTATLTTRPDGNGVESLSLNATAQTAATGAGLTVLYTPGTGVLLINGPAASLATYETILQGIVYNNTSDTPTATDRTVNVVVNDGTDPSAVNTVTISVTAANDAPVTDLNGTVPAGDDATASFTEQTPVVIAPAATIADVDSTTLVSLTATLTTRPDGNGVESLSLNATAQTAATGAGLTVLYTPGTGVLLINGPAASLATYETILQGIVYNNTSDTPTATDRTVNVVVNDGTDPSAVNTVTISVTAQNDAPNLTPDAPAAALFTENAGSPTPLLATGAVTDPDNAADFAGGSFQVEITANGGAADQIVLRTGSGFHVNGGNLELDAGNVVVGAITGIGTTNVQVTGFTADVTPSVANALSQAFAFTNPGQDPGALTRAVTFTFDDGDGGTSTDTVIQQVQVTPLNDQPTLTATAANVDFTEGAGNAQGAQVAVFTNTIVNTVEAGQGILSLTFTVSGLHDGANERIQIDGATFSLTDGANGATTNMTYAVTLVGNALAGQTATVTLTTPTAVSAATMATIIDGIRYQNTNVNAPTVDNRVFTLTQIQDDGGSGGGNDDSANLNVSSSVDVVAVNDGPSNTVPGAQNATEDANFVFSAGAGNAIQITDLDAGSQNVQVTLSVANGFLDVRTNGEGGLTTGLNSWQVSGDTTGSVTLTGTVAQINASLGGANGQLVYRGNLNFDGVDTLTVTTNDLGHTGTDPGLTGNGTFGKTSTRSRSTSPTRLPPTRSRRPRASCLRPAATRTATA